MSVVAFVTIVNSVLIAVLLWCVAYLSKRR